MKLKDFAYESCNGIQVCFDWSIFGTPQNWCVDFLTIQDMNMLDERFDNFVETETCPYIEEVEESMVGRYIDKDTEFEQSDMEYITHWFVNETETCYIAIIEW